MTGAYDWQLVLYHAPHAPRHPHAELSRGEYACAQRPKEGRCLGTSVTCPKLRRPPSTLLPPKRRTGHQLARERRRQHRATVENEAHACVALALTGRYLLLPPTFKRLGQRSSGREPISGTSGL
jgi:hypothetical protein